MILDLICVRSSFDRLEKTAERMKHSEWNSRTRFSRPITDRSERISPTLVRGGFLLPRYHAFLASRKLLDERASLTLHGCFKDGGNGGGAAFDGGYC